MKVQPILLNGEWVASKSSRTFHATNPKTREPIPEEYPISDWAEVEAVMQAAAAAFATSVAATNRIQFLEKFADRIDARATAISEMAAAETGLPVEPRLKNVELPRTTNQLRQAAAAAREGSWQRLTIDTASNIRSMYQPVGPVCVFGPNNFPLAFNSIAGGDFAAAVAAGNPVIAKANSSHPGTTRLLAEEANLAAKEAGLPEGWVQLLYRLDHADGEKLVSHPLVGATGYTGSRSAGLALKRAADAAGKPIYLELSSVNPVVILPGALKERGDKLAEEFQTSCLMGTGQFCTNPGLVLLLADAESDAFISAVAERFRNAPAGTLLSGQVAASLAKSVETLQRSGADCLAGGKPVEGKSYSFQNTLLCASGKAFIQNSEGLQTEAFGNCSLIVVAANLDELVACLGRLEGNLTGCIYSHTGKEDDAAYGRIEPVLRRKVGRILNDKMPTGVAVVSSMNHGGPYPATGHPGFTAVGIPASLTRFAALCCYDNVRPHRLPLELRDHNVTSTPWRLVDGNWTRGDVG